MLPSTAAHSSVMAARPCHSAATSWSHALSWTLVSVSPSISATSSPMAASPAASTACRRCWAAVSRSAPQASHSACVACQAAGASPASPQPVKNGGMGPHFASPSLPYPLDSPWALARVRVHKKSPHLRLCLEWETSDMGEREGAGDGARPQISPETSGHHAT